MKLKLKRLFENIQEFYIQKISRFLDKVKYALTHNFLVRSTNTHLILFSFIKLRMTNRRRQAAIGIAFIMIWIIGYLIFSLYPVFYTLFLSFFKVRLNGADIRMDFEAFNNYKAAFVYDPYFVEVIVEYVMNMIINVPVVIVFALLIAILINQPIKGKGFWRTIFFLPVIISSGPIISELIDRGATTLPSIEDYTIVNMVLENIGDFLATPLQNLLETILLVLWFSGIQILILLAGLQKIDRSIYEASMIDGAGPWESFWKITLPSIMPLISVSVIYTVVSMSVFSLNEVIIYIKVIMLGESVVGTLTSGYGYSAALSWIYFFVMLLIIGTFLLLLNIKHIFAGRRSKA